MRLQRTLKTPVSFRGVGVHTGREVTMSVVPSCVNTGIVINRTDINETIYVNPKYTVSSPLCTTIVNENGTKVRTVEHLLAALYAMQVDNAVVNVNSDEIPILDGSALEMINAFSDTIAQDAERKVATIEKELIYEDGDRSVRLVPYDGFAVDITCDFSSKGLACKNYLYEHSQDNFKREIAFSRTFGFLDDVSAIKSSGLALGASLENTVIFDNGACINEGGLRSQTEYITHKILDAIGDLSVIGMDIRGKFIAVRPGHSINCVLAKMLAERFH